MKKVNIYELRTHFGRYAKCVREGQTVMICDRNKPFAELRPIDDRPKCPPLRPSGLYAGEIRIEPDFNDAAVNDGLASDFLGESIE